MSLEIGVEYKSISLASTYKMEDGKLRYVGYINPDITMIFEGVYTDSAGLEYGILPKVGSNVVYKISGTEGYAAASGCYVSTTCLGKVNTAGFTVDATMADGSTRKFDGIKLLDPPEEYLIRAGGAITTYRGPSTGAQVVGTVQGGNGQHRVTIRAITTAQKGAVTWGAVNSQLTVWTIVYDSAGRVTGNLVKLSTPAASITGEGNDPPDERTYITPDASFEDSTLSETLASMNKIVETTTALNSNASLEGLKNMQYVIGIPPYITRTADPQYLLNASPPNVFGRAYTEMYMVPSVVCSIQPLKVKYLPGFNTEERSYFYNAIAGAIGDALGDDEGIESELTGQLFEGQPDYNPYINTVNMFARVMAIYLGIGDKKYRSTGAAYKNMDYSWYKIRDDSHDSVNTSSLFSVVSSSARWVADKLVTTAINDDTYLHFYATADGTSANESMSVSTKSTSLESLFNNTFSSIAQEIQFLAGAESGVDFTNKVAEVANSIGEGVGNISKTLENIVKYGANYLNGGRLVFPQMLDDCNYDRSFTVSCRFISPSGDPEAIFLNCFLPLCYLYPYVIPQMMSDNMYKYPFLCRVNVPSLFHCDLAAMTNLRIQRGGMDGTAYTIDGLPFEIDVTFDITPLYSKLMATSSRHPILFLSNTALQEYLGAMCGVSFTGNQLMLKLSVLKTLLRNEITDTIPSLLRSYYSSTMAETIRKLFNF